MSELFDSTEGLVLVKAVIFGPGGYLSVRLALDTGATMTTISVPVLVSVGYDPGNVIERFEMTTGSSLEYVPFITIDKVETLGQSRKKFPVIAHTLPPSSGIDGLLGLDFFRDQELTINFRNGSISLR